MISTVTTKGQVTIPATIRKKYGIHPNDRVDFLIEGHRIILVPVKTLRDFRGAVRGNGEPDQERQAAKEAMGRRTIEEMS
ncbi:MAG: AbrB/MazE/SpoVT family DNA-binding domain-containing protein [Deltaproteobacteria bacterium]|nr:AbrB/MazE/SpoVT family DNA-binding domain-containing protein [Deltaproteobacteria bacterium]